MTTKNQIPDLDDYLNAEPTKKKRYIPAGVVIKEKPVPIKVHGYGAQSTRVVASQDLKPYKARNLNNLPTVNLALNKNAEKKLDYIIKKTPQYKLIHQQIEKLQQEKAVYKLTKSDDFVLKCDEMIADLLNKKEEFIKIFKNEKTPGEKKELQDKIGSSDLLKELKKKRKALELEYRDTNPNSLFKRIMEFRTEVDAKETLKNTDYDNPINLDSIYDENYLESEDDNEVDDLDKEYLRICALAADYCDTSVNEILQMPKAELLKQLKEYCPDTEEIKKNIDLVKVEASTEMKRLKGGNDITDIMWEIFDFDKEEAGPKELMTIANIKYVSAIAFSICKSANKLRYLDDCVSEGLFELQVAIKKWYDLQKLANTAVSFEGFAQAYIANAIKKQLFEFGGYGGTINKNSLATKHHKREKSIEMWIKINPDFAKIPRELLESVLDGLIEPMPRLVTSESDYVAIVGGEQEDNSDIFANSVGAENPHEDSFMDSQFEYEAIIKGIRDLFGLFQTETDKVTGEKVLTNKRIFNESDYRLFLLNYEFEFKLAGKGADLSFVQEEMAEIIEKYEHSTGQLPMNKTLSQSSISTRLKVILNKLKGIMNDNPSIKKGFEYFLYYCQANRGNINLLSNFRESLATENKVNTFVKNYNNNEKILSTTISNGRKLKDGWKKEDTNTLSNQFALDMSNYKFNK